MKRFIPLILLLLSLANCSGERCIDPDDFGNPTFTISARYKSEELEGARPDQIAPWRETGLKVNGRPLTIAVRNWDLVRDKNRSNSVSAWSSWFGTEENSSTLATIVERMTDCRFANNEMCPSNGNDAVIVNAPCLFKKGVGLYALIAEPGTNPNSSIENKTFPQGIAFHVGEPQNGYSMYSTNSSGDLETVGGIIFNYIVPSGQPQQTLKEQYVESSLYFKILDRDYSDNSGQYKIIIKSGVDVGREDPLSLVTRLVKERLFGSGVENEEGIIKNLYQGITEKQPAYKTVVRALLMLYITFSAFGFLIGSIKITNAELITRVLKVIVVSILLTANFSWNFFNDYLFVFFVAGVEYIIQMISDAVSGGGWGQLPLLQIMIAPQTFSKLFSLLFMSFYGWIYIILYLCLLFFVLLISIKATIIYLTALIVIGILIVLGPIFITFLLFDITKSLYENWIKQLISYALQPIILFTGMGLLSLLIMQEIYATLGFKVCKKDIFNFGPISAIIAGYEGDFGNGAESKSLFYFWFPEPRDPGEISTAKYNIPVPYDHFDSQGNFCQAYECIEKRIPDLPYLDPTNPRDQERIENFRSGKIIDFKNLFIFIISIYLLHKFNSITLSISQFLSNSSGNLTSLGSAASSAYTPIANFAENTIKNRVLSPAWRVIKNSPLGAPARLATNIAQRATTKIFEKIYKGELESGRFMSSQVRELAEKNSGIKYENLNMKDYKAYKSGLKELFSEAGVKGFPSSALARMDIKDLQKELALGKYNKDYSELNDAQKKELKALFEKTEAKLGRSLKEMQESLKDVNSFQKAYMDAHMEMTKNGIGYFRKHSKTLNKIHQLSDKYKKFKGPSEAEKLEKRVTEKTSRFYKLYDDALNKLTAGKLGNDFNYYDYQDNRMLTYGEQVIEKEVSNNFQELSNEINKRTVQEGDDVLSPNYLAKLENTSSKNAQYYNDLVREDIHANVYKALSQGDGDKPTLMGRRYMAERMSDDEFKESIDKAYNLQEELVKNDSYLSNRSAFEQHYESSAKALEESLSKIEDTKLAEQIREKIDNGSLSHKETEKMLKDEKYASLKAQIEEHQHNKAVIEKLDEREELIRDEVGSYVNEMNSFRQKANFQEYKPYTGTNNSTNKRKR